MNRITMLAAAMLLCLTARTEAADVPLRTIKVQYADLNLAQPQGASALYGRIRVAARKVCGHTGVQGLLMAPKEAACRRASMDAAIDSIDNPLLSAVHRQNSGAAVTRQMAGGALLR